MKKFMVIFLLFLTGCEYYEVDCEKYPSATVCQSGVVEVEKPITEVEEPEMSLTELCETYPGHAECIEPFSATKPHNNGPEFTLSNVGVYGTYPDGYFNTFISMRVYLSSDQHPNDYQSMAIRMAEQYHRLADKYNNYDGVVNIKTINDNPAEKHYVEKELYDLLKFSVLNYETSMGYFDISIGPVSSLWHDKRVRCQDYYMNENFCELPDVEQVESVSGYVNINGIILNDEEMSIQMSEGMSLDLGGVAKGYFAEKLAEKFAQNGARAFVINAGGNIKTYGEKPRDDGMYHFGIQDPFKPRGEGIEGYRLQLPGGYSAVSSGDQENYFIVEDVVYHHIISPFTFMPDHYSRQVTVVTNDSRAADILSTTIYLLPIEEGIAFVNGLENVEALWIDFDGNVHVTEGMNDFLE